MAKEKKILIVCGEPSGDVNAAALVRGIKQIYPDVIISGVGGEFLRKAGVNIYSDIKDLAVLGLFDALKKLPAFFALKDFLMQKIKEGKPDAVILVDFSGFNLRLAREINNSVPVIYYISPQVWASRRGRLKSIKKYISRMIVLFKFEEKFYKKYGVEVDCVGHPLLDIVKPSMGKKELLDSLKFKDSRTTIALLPGSRKSEVENILPLMLKSAKVIRRKLLGSAQFLIAKSPQVKWDIYNRLIIKAGKLDLKIVEGKTYDCLNAADFALVASGTATLETLIMQKPFVIIYRLSLLNYLLYLPQVKIPYIGMVNILAGKKIVPEFIQFGATPQKIAKETLRILKDPARLEQMQKELARAKASLGEPGASLRAAHCVVSLLQ
ncbi:MAG: lipid-A-disaccharide synthase [Candidatus Omnitrophica bacterium]|nr:lipid-A-disaccharide synthase [Candidatus Omnitrophota bacterium]MBL7210347.1 lipid-A-disaccharide synthase [Candidatus Omnitrophota bacterium]